MNETVRGLNGVRMAPFPCLCFVLSGCVICCSMTSLHHHPRPHLMIVLFFFHLIELCLSQLLVFHFGFFFVYFPCLIFILCWSIVYLQCYISFRYTVKWFSYTYIYSFSDSCPILVVTEYWVEFPVLYSRSLLSIYTATAKPLQSCPTLCDPIDSSPPGSAVPGILQARIVEWVAISFSNAGKWKVKVKSPSCVWLLATPWTAAHQAPPSMEFSRQEYWSGVPLPSPIYI